MNDGMKNGLKFVGMCALGSLFIAGLLIPISSIPHEDEYQDCQQAAEYIQKSVNFTITVKQQGKGYKSWNYTAFIDDNTRFEGSSSKSECDAIKKVYPSVVVFNKAKEEVEDGE